MNHIITLIATELKRSTQDVAAVITLLDEGATVPFIARYRKEMTGAMNDIELRLLAERLDYLRELEARKEVVLQSIDAQGKLDDALKQAIAEAQTKTVLEDLYLPFKPKRRTKAQIAREAGLEPLAQLLATQPAVDPHTFAEKFLNPEHQIDDVASALQGARQILMETMSEQPELVGGLREYFWNYGVLVSSVIPGKEVEAKQFSDYFAYDEKIKIIPSHRALALLRGQRSGFLRLKLTVNEAEQQQCFDRIAKQNKLEVSDATHWLCETITQTFKVKLCPKLEIDLLVRLKTNAETQAIAVFAENLKHLLLAAPAGGKIVMGLDPGLRTGVKVAVIDCTGKLLTHCTVYPHQPRREWKQAIKALAKVCTEYHVHYVSIGNGTGSRETDKLVAELMQQHPELKLTKVVVSEAGASVYSASELGSQEFPDLDVSFRGAVSIARRLQDPLAELVKIEPKAIGVGQYQHDVNQQQLARALDGVVEDCVNFVGVDLNRASAALLRHVAGLNQNLAEQIVYYRDQHGAFDARSALQQVPRLGAKTFEQAAGFLRISDGTNPLDCSGVHPEAYPIVEDMLKKSNKTVHEIMGNTDVLQQLRPEDFVNEHFGLPTVKDIFKELEKPGRDPRPEFKVVQFKEGIDQISDLASDMCLQGIITNVTDFGAFVDIGVHQDGLVHKSEMAVAFVADPKKFVKVGQIVEVKVLQVDAERKRINLTMKLQSEAAAVKNTARPEKTAAAHAATAPRTQQEKNMNHAKTATANAPAKQHRGSMFGSVLTEELNKWRSDQGGK